MSEQHPMVGRVLTSRDPQPPAGTRVRDDCGTVWVNDGHYPVCWVEPNVDYHDPESWNKIAGNYGPVTILEWGEEEHWEHIRRDADAIARHLTETLLPPELRAAGIRFEWQDQP